MSASSGDHSPRYRLFVTAPLAEGARIALDPARSHYLGTVLRGRVGEAVALFNGHDGEWRAEIAALGRGRGELRVDTRLREQAPEPDLWLCFAPLKKERSDLVAEKAGELGVSLLQPVFTARTNAGRVNIERLGARAMEAAEQCGRLTVPAVRAPVDLADLLRDWPADRRLYLCDETGTAPPAADVLARPDPLTRQAVVIGPEGGLEAAEFAALRGLAQTRAISLGPRTLRAETAAIVALALVQALVGAAADLS